MVLSYAMGQLYLTTMYRMTLSPTQPPPMRVVCKVNGLTLLLQVVTLWRCGNSLFLEVPPMASNALLTTLHPYKSWCFCGEWTWCSILGLSAALGVRIVLTFHQTLMMMTEMVIETLVQYIHLTWLIAREDFIKFTRRESTKTYNYMVLKR